MDEWPMQKVLHDWRTNPPEKLHHTLPVTYTRSIVRRLRANACCVEKPDLTCAKWSQEHPSGPPGPDEWWREDETPPFMKTTEYVCGDGDCKKPVVNNLELQRRLLEKESDGKAIHKTFRRYLSGEVAMSPNTFRKLVVQAFTERWIPVQWICQILPEIDKLEAAKRVLIRFIKSAKKHPDFLERLSPEQSIGLRAQCSAEYELELKALEKANSDRVIARLDTLISDELRECINDWVANWDAREGEEGDDRPEGDEQDNSVSQAPSMRHLI